MGLQEPNGAVDRVRCGEHFIYCKLLQFDEDFLVDSAVFQNHDQRSTYSAPVTTDAQGMHEKDIPVQVRCPWFIEPTGDLDRSHILIEGLELIHRRPKAHLDSFKPFINAHHALVP